MTTPPEEAGGAAKAGGAAGARGAAGASGAARASGAAGTGGAAGADAAAEGQPRSGLRNPAAAVRGLGSGTLALEAIVLLLAIQPIRILGGHLSGWGVAAVVTLAVLCALVAGMMKRSWAWPVGTVLQALLLASGLLHWSLAALGLIFGAAWAYAIHVRRSILNG